MFTLNRIFTNVSLKNFRMIFRLSLLILFLTNCSFKYHSTNIPKEERSISFDPPKIEYYLVNNLKIKDQQGKLTYSEKEEMKHLDNIMRDMQNKMTELGLSTTIIENQLQIKSNRKNIIINCNRFKEEVPDFIYNYVNPVIFVLSLGIIPTYDNSTYTYEFKQVNDSTEVANKTHPSSGEFYISISTWEGWFPLIIGFFGDEWKGKKVFHRYIDTEFGNYLAIQVLKFSKNRM
ncbi:MAG: hypothetical protein SFU98_17995 [Leptospiraceae bacterium]|nr:hypothetical protein [Leptospiraceae bacterium]